MYVLYILYFNSLKLYKCKIENMPQYIIFKINIFCKFVYIIRLCYIQVFSTYIVNNLAIAKKYNIKQNLHLNFMYR